MAKPVRHYDKWRIRWFDEDGKRHSQVFDTHDDALFFSRRVEVEVEEIKRGLREPRIPKKSFSDLADYWLNTRGKAKRSYADDLSIIRTHLKPAFGSLDISRVDIAAVDHFLAAKAHLNPKTVNNHLTLLISMLNLARDLGWLRQPPKIRKYSIKNTDFSYLTTGEEVHRFLEAARSEGSVAFALYASAIYTGMRQGELAGLKWEDINWERREIRVQRSFEGLTKSGKSRIVPILDPLLPLLRQWRLSNSCIHIFVNQNGKMFGESSRVFQEVFHRVLEKGKFPKRIRHGKERNYIVFHDLRHTFASHWMMNNGSLYVLRDILGHESITTTMRYAHLSPDTFVKEYGRLGSHSLSQQEAKMIKLFN